jgi:hypothetical protein
MASPYVLQAKLELTVLLPQSPKQLGFKVCHCTWLYCIFKDVRWDQELNSSLKTNKTDIKGYRMEKSSLRGSRRRWHFNESDKWRQKEKGFTYTEQYT